MFQIIRSRVPRGDHVCLVTACNNSAVGAVCSKLAPFHSSSPILVLGDLRRVADEALPYTLIMQTASHPEVQREERYILGLEAAHAKLVQTIRRWESPAERNVARGSLRDWRRARAPASEDINTVLWSIALGDEVIVKSNKGSKLNTAAVDNLTKHYQKITQAEVLKEFGVHGAQMKATSTQAFARVLECMGLK